MRSLILSLLMLSTGLEISFAKDPAASPASKYDNIYIDAASLPDSVRSDLARIHPGMARAEVERILTADGGWAYGSRYYVRNFVVKSKVVMIEIEFQPAGMPDAIYADILQKSEWSKSHVLFDPKAWGKDVVRAVGKPYFSGIAID